jgi:hypothetical protein
MRQSLMTIRMGVAVLFLTVVAAGLILLPLNPRLVSNLGTGPG